VDEQQKYPRPAARCCSPEQNQQPWCTAGVSRPSFLGLVVDEAHARRVEHVRRVEPTTVCSPQQDVVFLVRGMACKWAASRAHGAAPGATIVYSLSAEADALSDCPKQNGLQMQAFPRRRARGAGARPARVEPVARGRAPTGPRPVPGRLRRGAGGDPQLAAAASLDGGLGDGAGRAPQRPGAVGGMSGQTPRAAALLGPRATPSTCERTHDDRPPGPPAAPRLPARR
jgi:hypothetical protein